MASLSSCRKVSGEKVDFFPHRIEVPQSGGTFIVDSKVKGFALYNIFELREDGRWNTVRFEAEILNNGDVVCMTSESICVRKVRSTATGYQQLKIDVSDNNTGSARTFNVKVSTGDSGGNVILVQK